MMTNRAVALAESQLETVTESRAQVIRTRLPAHSYLTMVSSAAGLQALEQDWRELESNPSTPMTVFQTFDWVNAWCQTYARNGELADVRVIAGYCLDRLVFVWPLMRHKVHGTRILSWLTEPFGQYGDVICAPEQNARLWVSEALNYLRELKDFDIIRLRHVRDTGTLSSCADELLVDARLNERAPFLDLTAFKTEDDYEQRYSATQRRRRKRIRKRIEAFGPLEFSKLAAGGPAEHAMARAFEEKNKWLADRGRMNRVLGCPSHIEFLKKLLNAPSNGVEVVVTQLQAGSEPLSWEIGFRHRGIHYGYVTSHLNTMTDTSVGRLHMDLSQRACVNDGMKAYDLMLPYDVHKESWSSGCIGARDYFKPFTMKGWLYGHLYLRTLRPLVREMYYRMPTSVLRWVNPKAALARSQQRNDTGDEC